MAPGLFDSHSHINASQFDGDRDAVIARMRAAGMAGAMVVACDWGEEALVRELVAAHPDFLVGAWALHPEYEDRVEPTVEQIEAICSTPGFVAVGETGLDYYWCKGDLTWQKERFVRHIEAAKNLNKPLIIHAREAEADALDILIAHNAKDVGFVMHCFGGDLATARRCVDAGGLISLTGVVTFKKSDTLQEIAKAIPLDRLMVETDCPYMAPVPLRGKRNEPAYLEHIARKIAELKDIAYEEVVSATTRTAVDFFRLG